jgi:hydrogenase large subunit
MTTMITTKKSVLPKTEGLVEMSWDPITRIVGSLGIFTKIDFKNRQVAECYSTSSIFRGYSIFMKNKDPRDAHFITSRICGICGDNHATCAVYAQNMAFGTKTPPLGEWIINLGEAAEYMFDHNIFQDNLVGVDFCEQMIKETNPGVWDKAQRKEAPHAAVHGYRTIADIMTALNPFTGEFYRETLAVSRNTREMFCLMEGRHVHPSTLYPGGTGTPGTIQVFTDYLVRLMKYVEFMKKVVPLHDDLFDFMYEALPGYEKVGYRRTLLGCWGSFNNPNECDYRYEHMDKWGRAMYVTPSVIVDGKVVTNSLVDINLGIRILLGHSYYDDWGYNGDKFVDRDPLGNPVDMRHPWNQTTQPKPQTKCAPAETKPGRSSKFQKRRSAADFTKQCEACSHITSSSRKARSRIITHTRQRRGMRALVMCMERRVRMKTRYKTRRYSKKTARTSSKASTSCALFAASIRVYRAACICMSAAAKF